jgi:hypothetical protein
MPHRELSDYFKFDAADLYANQSGRFTEKQQLRILQLDRSRRRLGMFIGIVMELIAFIGLAIGVATAIGNPDPAMSLPFGLGFGLFWPLVWGGIGFFVLKDALTRREFKVARVQGPARLIRRKYRQRQRPGIVRVRDDYDLHIGDEILKAQGDVGGAITQGAEYIAYYVESSRDILSVEEVGSQKQAAA